MSKLAKLVRSPRLFVADALASQFQMRRPSSARASSGVKSNTKNLDLRRVNPLGGYSMILHSGEGSDGISHLAQWIPAFIQSGVKFVVLVRSAGLFKTVAECYPKLDVALISSAVDVERFILAHSTLKFICYSSNTGNNIHLVRYTHLTHVFIGHGDSDKSASAHKVFRMFDEVWTAGRAHHDRFLNADFSVEGLRFHEVGRPGLRVSLAAAKNSWADRVALGVQVLYLPTWEGYFSAQDYSSLRIASDIIFGTAKAFPGARLRAKFHPFTGKRSCGFSDIQRGLELLAREQGIAERVRAIPTAVPIEELIADANIVICDISAVVTDCLAADCPIFVYVPQDRQLQLSESQMPYDDYAYVFSSVEGLHDAIRSVLEQGDRLAGARAEAREYILGISAIESGAFLKHIRRLAPLDGAP